MTQSIVEYNFTSIEICVLAALLGHSRVVGVEYNDFGITNVSISNAIKTLQSKNIILIDFYGRLKLNKKLKQIIDVICDPTSFLINDIETKTEKTRCYYCKKRNVVVSLSKRDSYLYSLSFVVPDDNMKSLFEGELKVKLKSKEKIRLYKKTSNGFICKAEMSGEKRS